MRRSFWSKVIVLVVVIALLIVATYALIPQYHAAPQAACLGQLLQLGRAAREYAHAHGGEMPDHLQSLFDDGDLAPEVLICPSSNLLSLSGATTRAADEAIKNGKVSYVYLGKGLTVNSPPDTVLLYEPLSNHGRNGINIVFVNGESDCLDVAEAQNLIAGIESGQRPVQFRHPWAATQP